MNLTSKLVFMIFILSTIIIVHGSDYVYNDVYDAGAQPLTSESESEPDTYIYSGKTKNSDKDVQTDFNTFEQEEEVKRIDTGTMTYTPFKMKLDYEKKQLTESYPDGEEKVHAVTISQNGNKIDIIGIRRSFRGLIGENGTIVGKVIENDHEVGHFELKPLKKMIETTDKEVTQIDTGTCTFTPFKVKLDYEKKQVTESSDGEEKVHAVTISQNGNDIEIIIVETDGAVKLKGLIDENGTIVGKFIVNDHEVGHFELKPLKAQPLTSESESEPDTYIYSGNPKNSDKDVQTDVNTFEQEENDTKTMMNRLMQMEEYSSLKMSNMESLLSKISNMESKISNMESSLSKISDMESWLSRMYKPNYVSFQNKRGNATATLETQVGVVKTCGSFRHGGDSSKVAQHLQSGVVKIFTTQKAFAALKKDGSVITWGLPKAGGDSFKVEVRLQSNVQNIFSTDWAFAALKKDGSVITWGSPSYGGDSYAVAQDLKSDVDKIFSTPDAFAALKQDGKVITWGDSGGGGDSSKVTQYLQSGVVNIVSNEGAFAALKRDGTVVTWGSRFWGGDSSNVAQSLVDIATIESTSYGFRAIKKDGSQIEW